ncbi:DUF4031 domain-containing protein [Ornithinimicrobium sp. F0845]|uniref:HD domain-containing protein n=1 Tax=Ornithinimicrobium sp. F0845 TaxID=2926412 RepID=UPI001FF6BC90|nr:DUF4031 domain-containing protein [Ornithinimicrobium sp. F0845]MCK0110840.1 DUF4031 domain-containing protein [Ornithinimicrobium sp. F0845]
MPTDPPRRVPAQAFRQLTESWHTDTVLLAPEAPPALREAEVERLLAGWSEPHRRYHDARHLREVLGAVEELAAAGETDAVGARLARVAGWYHDLAYDPQAAAGSNEHRSATLARDHLNALGVAQGTVDVVEALILMTVDHDPDGEHPAMASRRHTAAVLHDADLWILSAPDPRYREYAGQVRDEYAHVPDDLFVRGRAAVLSGFAQRPELYRTAHARTHWEPRARANVTAELARLEA